MKKAITRKSKTAPKSMSAQDAMGLANLAASRAPLKESAFSFSPLTLEKLSGLIEERDEGAKTRKNAPSSFFTMDQTHKESLLNLLILMSEMKQIFEPFVEPDSIRDTKVAPEKVASIGEACIVMFIAWQALQGKPVSESTLRKTLGYDQAYVDFFMNKLAGSKQPALSMRTIENERFIELSTKGKNAIVNLLQSRLFDFSGNQNPC